MKIKYLGHSCFQLRSANGTAIVTDPYTKVGYELPKGLFADVVTVSHSHFDHNYTQAIQTDCVISTAGRHQIKQFEIIGINSYHDPRGGALRGGNVIFKLQIDEVSVCHFGDLGEPVSKALLEKIGKVDVLLLPIGGTYTIDAAQAKEYVDFIAPKIVIPMHFKPVDGTIDIDGVSAFLSRYPQDIITQVNCGEIELQKESLPKTLRIYHLERQKYE